jgi:hypothetical protein
VDQPERQAGLADAATAQDDDLPTNNNKLARLKA